LTRLLLAGLGLAVRSQVRLFDELGLMGRVDFLVGEKVVVEFDGLVKYEGAQGREALAAEKRREDRLRAAGYEVVRLTWADLDRPDRVARMVRVAVARANAR
jgi:very-short-patch-repair endonuclease